jgi:GH15 family glucan-1,4-alpha-glucosidase
MIDKNKVSKIAEKSTEVLENAQLTTGGVAASLAGTRYAGNVYPRDHAYATRAFISIKNFERAKKALEFILECPLSEDNIMYQRYNEKKENSSYKPPQIDGNAQTIISVHEYTKSANDRSIFEKYQKKITALLDGIYKQTHTFPHGNLTYTINGIIEFAPFEQGYDLYTNACVYKALKESHLDEEAEKIKKGIEYYLYYPQYGGFMPCLRSEPDASLVLSAHLKAFLALTDFDIFAPDDERIVKSLEFHLNGTKNSEVGGYNRYSYEIGRHNFGNGPWPMVMLRLADYYRKSHNEKKMQEIVEWVLNIAEKNIDIPFGLPEHVVAKDEFLKTYEGFKKMDEVSPRPAKKTEYETILKSRVFSEKSLAYAINPLMWSHAQFLIVMQDMQLL